MSEFDAIRFVEGQQFHRSTVDQLDLRELDGDDMAFRERGAKDFQVFPCNPTADAKNGACSIESRSILRVRSRGLLPGCLNGKRDASRNPLKCR